MKVVCLDKKSFMLLALILRQFGLSVGRSGSDTVRVSGFFKDNFRNYTLLREKLAHIIEVNNFDIVWNQNIERKFPSGIWNLFIKKTCFFESDFRHITKVYFTGFEILKSGKIEQDENWMVLGQELMMYSQNLIDSKLSKKERKIVNRIEHFDQNPAFDATSYSIKEALSLLLKEPHA